MKNKNDSQYKKFKRVMVIIGVIALFGVIHAVIFLLFPYIKEIHGF